MRVGLFLRLALAASVTLLAASCDFAPAADPGDARSYRVRMAVVPAPEAALQRLSLPPSALAALQRADLADLRIFDSNGKTLPMALIMRSDRSERKKIRLPSFPILGTAGSLKLTGVSLKIDDQQQARVVGVDGTVEDTNPGKAVVIGALLDTRAIIDPAVGIAIGAELPAQQPVTFAVDASTDLKNWNRLAEKVIYRAGSETGPSGSETIALPSADLRNHYVRISWSAASGLLSPVAVKGATIVTSRRVSRDRPAIDTTAPRLIDSHDIRFSLPFATPLAALKIVPEGRNIVIPVRLFGRNNPEESWMPLASGTIYRIEGDAKRPASDTLELDGPTYRHFRIVADRRTPGFSEAPRLRLLFDPVEIVALFDGATPFTLAAGLPSASNTYLPVRELLPDYGPNTAMALPTAMIDTPPEPAPPLTLAPADADGPLSGRSLVLWALLLLGTAVLGAMVWALYRKSSGRGRSTR